MGTRTAQRSPFRLLEVVTGAWGEITEPPVLELTGFEVRVTCPQVTVRLAYDPLPGYPQILPTGRWPGALRSLDGVPGHRDAGPGLRRFAFVDAPLHGALHQVLDTSRIAPDYCDVHRHDDAAELNVLLPGDPAAPLEYAMHVRTPFAGRAPLVAWIPPGTDHAATASAGTGYFLVLRVPLA